MNLPKFGQGVSDWNPGPGPSASDATKNKLMSTEAMDAPDTISATNDLKEFKGKSGVPSGPFGQHERGAF